MSWHIYVRGKTEKHLKKLPVEHFYRIERAIDEMRINPYAGDIQKMGGSENVWRRRIGPYRVKLEIREKDKLVYIFEIERRTSSTY